MAQVDPLPPLSGTSPKSAPSGRSGRWGRSGWQHLVESNWSSVSIDEKGDLQPEGHSAQPIEVRNATWYPEQSAAG